MKTRIEHVILYTKDEKDTVIKDGYCLIDGDRIAALGPMKGPEPVPPADTVLDGQGGILMPGMINLHAHLSMIPFRGLGDDTKDRLRKFLIPMENRWMDEELARLSARYAICESLLAGVTTVVDMYYFENAIMEEADDLGIRGFFGETVMDQKTPDHETPDEAIGDAMAQIENWASHPRVHGIMAPHSTASVSEETLKKSWAAAEKTGALYTLHTAEMDYEMTSFAASRYRTPVRFLHEIGALHSSTILAHAIHLTPEDIALIKESGASVAHCIGSNAKAAKGVAPLTKLYQAGVPVGLGTDGPSSGNTLDILTQMHLVADFHKNETHDRSAWPCRDITSLATREGARALHLDRKLGRICPGMQADLVLLETDSANMFPVYDPGSTIVYSANQSNVRDVFVDGRMLVRDKKLTDACLHGDSLQDIRERLLAKMKTTDFRPIGVSE